MLGKYTSINQGGNFTLQSRMMGFPIVGCGVGLGKRSRFKRQGNRRPPADDGIMFN